MKMSKLMSRRDSWLLGDEVVETGLATVLGPLLVRGSPKWHQAYRRRRYMS